MKLTKSQALEEILRIMRKYGLTLEEAIGMVRRAARIDANQPAIVEALRQLGAFVQPLHMVGQGCPDLLVAFRGQTLLVEIKDGSKPPSERRLTPDQQIWHSRWIGGPLSIVTDIDGAIRAVGVVEQERA